MGNSSYIDGLVATLAEVIQKRQKKLSEYESIREQYEKEVEETLQQLADDERSAHAQLRRVEECRRTLLDLQASQDI